MSAQTLPPRPGPQRPKLPAGLKWSNVWKVGGQFVESDDPTVELPVNAAWEIRGRLWVCPVEGCAQNDWTFEDIADEAVPCCPKHPARLVPAPLQGGDANPVAGARARVRAHIRGVYEARKLRAQQAVQARIDAAQKAVADATRRTSADMRGHIPSIAASVSVLGAGLYVELTSTPLAALVGAGMATVGWVVAYLVAYLVRRIQAADRADAKQAGKDRKTAQLVAVGTFTAGLWLVTSAAASVLPLTGHILFTLLLGFLLMFAVNNEHWRQLWAARHRLKDMALRKAEAEARRAEQEATVVDREPNANPATVVDESDPAVVGARMAAEWARIANTPAAGNAFPQMIRTWIEPTKAQPVTAPIDGNLERIGWEYYGQADPGALVARPGTTAPVTAARDWLAAVLFDGAHAPSTVSLVDRPGGAANRFTLIITDSIPLGEPVRWQGRAGVRRLADGTVQAHTGRAIDGNDVYQAIYTPTQPFGGLDTGTRGGGKTGGTILYLLNCLVAGVFPILFDPKQLVDYADFIGVFPIGVTQEHRDVILEFLVAVRKYRERLMGRTAVLDEFGRKVHGESRWDLKYGPPIAHVWEEFHDLAQDEPWVNRLTNHIRFERSSAMGGKLVTQGGGLADISNSILRGLLQKTELTTYRQDDHQARLAGRKDGAYTASDLPPLPGMRLVVSPDAPVIPMRTAYVPRTLNHPDSVFNQLYGRSHQKNLLLPPPALPEETLQLLRRTGLAEIWERAQGDDGLDRLLADAENEEYGGPSPAPDLAGVLQLPAADVLLAIVLLRQGCTRAFVDGHAAWNNPMAGGHKPSPSTISRAAARLEKDGKLSRTDGTWWVLDKAAGDAKAAAATLGLVQTSIADDETSEEGDG